MAALWRAHLVLPMGTRVRVGRGGIAFSQIPLRDIRVLVLAPVRPLRLRAFVRLAVVCLPVPGVGIISHREAIELPVDELRRHEAGRASLRKLSLHRAAHGARRERLPLRDGVGEGGRAGTIRGTEV